MITHRFGIFLAAVIFILPVYRAFPADKVLNDRVDWEVHDSPAFMIYHAEGAADRATEAAEILEKEFDRVTDLVGFIPVEKLRIYLIPEDQPDVRIPGSGKIGVVRLGQGPFRQDLLFAFSDCLINRMFSRRDLRHVDTWFINGIKGYLAGIHADPAGFPAEIDPEGLDGLEGPEAMRAGILLWDYLVKMNGEGAIAHILNSARILRSDQGAIAQFMDVPFETILNNARKFYDKQ